MGICIPMLGENNLTLNLIRHHCWLRFHRFPEAPQPTGPRARHAGGPVFHSKKAQEGAGCRCKGSGALGFSVWGLGYRVLSFIRAKCCVSSISGRAAIKTTRTKLPRDLYLLEEPLSSVTAVWPS